MNTFTEFQATHVYTDDLGAALCMPEIFLDTNGVETKVAGFTYGAYFIEICDDDEYLLTIENRSIKSASLVELERQLYDYARESVV